MNTNDEADSAFGNRAPFSVGVEEELFLVDPLTGQQTNSAAAMHERLGPIDPADGSVEAELHACMAETITGICESAGEAGAKLARLRRAVSATGAGMLGAGTHPSAAEGEGEITDKARYERIRELLGDAVATPVSGLHIHVGMPDAETAIRAFNGLRAHLPLLQALAANSPFRHGRDTGLASAREVTIRGWPRSGVPRAMRDYDDFRSATRRLSRAADVPDYTWFWWKLRPHPKLGTVEVRALDAQTSLDDTTALVALTHCLARHAADSDPADVLPPEILEEATFRAARFGVAAQLPDAEGTLHPVHELLERALETAATYSDELRCATELERLSAMVADGGGATRQRRIYEIAGMSALLRELTELSFESASASSY
jgi:carboxylate-amine ligase